MAMTTVAKPRTDLKRPATAHTEDVDRASISSHDQRLSVAWIGQLVQVAVKPERSRPIEHDEFLQLCSVLLSMIDPD
eukprot:5458664-Amphidinium_carterae.1